MLESRVVDENVGGDIEAVDGGAVGEVGLSGQAADRVGDRLGGVAIDVEDGDRGTGLGQSAGAGESDAPRRPSDQGAAAGQVDPGGRRPSACRADLIRSAHFAASFPGVLVRVVAFDRARDLRPPPRSQRQSGVDSVVVKLRR